MSRLRVVSVALFCAVFVYYVWQTLHWPMLWDTPIMHTVRFMMSRGLHPYSDITDMNLPGSYITEAWGMAIFGWSDAAWRLYEFAEMALLTAAGFWFGGRRNWLMGIVAASFFLVMHASEGPRVATERDELMAVLLVLSSAAVVVAVRTMRPSWMLLCGAACALGTSIKPAAALMELGILTLLTMELRSRRQRATPYMLWLVVGNAIVVAVVLQFLLAHHALGPLWFIATKIIPNYTKLVQPGTLYMLRHMLPLAIVVPIVFALAVMKRGKLGFERALLLLGMVVGAVSYFMQHKGLIYHRYAVILFVLLWAGWEISEAMHREQTRDRILATASLLCLFFVVVPYYIHLTLPNPRSAEALSPLSFQLQRDLTQLGGDHLQKQVLCLDMIDGCFDALYRMRLLQNTGATGDTLLFSPQHDFAVDYYQNWFWQQQTQRPANVVVLVNEWYQNDEQASFRKIDAWPRYANVLRTQYVPVIERHFGPYETSQAYRIYLRKGSDVLAREVSATQR